jgi:hypothetical protein
MYNGVSLEDAATPLHGVFHLVREFDGAGHHPPAITPVEALHDEAARRVRNQVEVGCPDVTADRDWAAMHEAP